MQASDTTGAVTDIQPAPVTLPPAATHRQRPPEITSLGDLNSNKVSIKVIPKKASQTCRGQILIKPIVDPIPYEKEKERVMGKETQKQFRVLDEDIDGFEEVHRVDHVS